MIGDEKRVPLTGGAGLIGLHLCECLLVKGNDVVSVNPIGLRACDDEGTGCAAILFLAYQRRHGLKIKRAHFQHLRRASDGP
jgi:nucleoside-diphosphate-sugar epimerase